jgi:hypothetical protein
MRADGAHQRVIVRGGPASFYNNLSFPPGRHPGQLRQLAAPGGAKAESSVTWAAWATGNAPAPAHQPRVRQQARLGTPA